MGGGGGCYGELPVATVSVTGMIDETRRNSQEALSSRLESKLACSRRLFYNLVMRQAPSWGSLGCWNNG